MINLADYGNGGSAAVLPGRRPGVGSLRFAFYRRASTEDWQDPMTSRASPSPTTRTAGPPHRRQQHCGRRRRPGRLTPEQQHEKGGRGAAECTRHGRRQGPGWRSRTPRNRRFWGF